MILLYLFGSVLGFFLLCVGALVKDEVKNRKGKFRGSVMMVVGGLAMFVCVGCGCDRCTRVGDSYTISKDFNEVTGEPRNPFPFNH